MCTCQETCTLGPGYGEYSKHKGGREGAQTYQGCRDNNTLQAEGGLFYGGQGSYNSLVTPDCIDNTAFVCEVRSDQGGACTMEGLCPPRLEVTGDSVRGEMKRVLRKENRQRQCMLKIMQATTSQWITHSRTTSPTMLPKPHEGLRYRNSMRPWGRALSHPAVNLLMEWAMFGCPTQTGRPWSKKEIWEAVAWRPYKAALSLEALAHFAKEAARKVRLGQACIVNWDNIKDNPPKELKILPIAAIPHRSKAFRSILDISFCLRLKNGGVLVAVNDTTEKNCPKRRNQSDRRVPLPDNPCVC